MTDKLREAAQQALEALDNMTDSQGNPARRNFPTIHDYGKSRRAADALRAALAQQDAQAVPRGWKLVPVEPTPEMVRAAYTHGGGVEADWQAMLNAAPAPTAQDVTWNEYVETACALIKAADDAAADGDYMLDSNDCIKVLRGQWKAPLANDCPPHPQPTQQDAQAINHIPDAREMVSPTYGSEEIRKLRETIQSMARIIRDYEAAPTPPAQEKQS